MNRDYKLLISNSYSSLSPNLVTTKGKIYILHHPIKDWHISFLLKTCGGPFCDFGLDYLLLYGGPSILDKRVRTGPTITYFGPTCAQVMPCLPKHWSYAYGR